MKPTHDSIRGWFAAALHDEMEKDERIWLITADLGWGMWDRVRDDFPDRFINVGASECAALGAAVGLALSGKVPFVYSITTFLLFRPSEWIRNYLNHEGIPVILVGSGINKDYAHDGISHQPPEDEIIRYFKLFPNVTAYTTDDKTKVREIITNLIKLNQPAFMCLRR